MRGHIGWIKVKRVMFAVLPRCNSAARQDKLSAATLPLHNYLSNHNHLTHPHCTVAKIVRNAESLGSSESKVKYPSPT